jgi:hypothetical protein
MTKTDFVTTKTPACQCPSCSKSLDMATGYASPTPGDLSLCSTCGAILEFSLDLKMTAANESLLALRHPKIYRKLLNMQQEIRAGALK